MSGPWENLDSIKANPCSSYTGKLGLRERRGPVLIGESEWTYGSLLQCTGDHPRWEEELSDTAKETGDAKVGSEFLSPSFRKEQVSQALFPKVLFGAPQENFLILGSHRKIKVKWDFFLPQFQSLVELWLSKHYLWWLSAYGYFIGLCLQSQPSPFHSEYYACNSSTCHWVGG